MIRSLSTKNIAYYEANLSGEPKSSPPTLFPMQRLNDSEPPSMHLLIVAFHQENLETIATTLDLAGVIFTYDVAADIAQSQVLLQKVKYDAVIWEEKMPAPRELPLLHIVQASQQEIPVILVAEILGQEGAIDCIKAGISDCVIKARLFRLPYVLRRALDEFADRKARELELLKLRSSQALLNQISRSLNSTLDLASILHQIVQLTGECFDVDRVVMFSLSEETVTAIEEWRASPEVSSLIGFQAPLDDWIYPWDPRQDLHDRWVFHMPEYDQMPKSPIWQAQIQQGQILSLLRVPIYIRRRLFGALSLHVTTHRRRFSQDEIHIFEQIADLAAIALHNTQNYSDLEILVKERTHQLEQEKILSEAANHAKTEFLSNMSHEFRTPLTGILGFSNVLLQQIFGPLTAKQKQYIASIAECGQHLLDLINDLLDLSKVEAGKEDLNIQTIIVEDLCLACLSLVRERIQNHGLELKLEIPPDITTCSGDQRRLKQILFNLLSNAIKFTPSGSITLRVEGGEGKIGFAVIDTGIGISPEGQSQLFQPFQQLHSNLPTTYEGTGLGLALSRKLAQLHNGDITLVSELGKGSTFTLWIPDRLTIDNYQLTIDN